MGHKEWQVVLDYWFCDIGSGAIRWQERADLWWGKNEKVDQEIRDKFTHFVNGLSEGGYRDWLGSAQGRLASIVVIDQFSRNVFRGDSKAFSADSLALQWCLDGIDCGDDLLLKPVERVFFYMPLEHSESPAMQQLSIANYTALVAAVPEAEKDAFRGFLDFAQRHSDVIAQFGRYPHRNKVLGRENTPEEQDFLEQPGSSF